MDPDVERSHSDALRHALDGTHWQEASQTSAAAEACIDVSPCALATPEMLDLSEASPQVASMMDSAKYPFNLEPDHICEESPPACVDEDVGDSGSDLTIDPAQNQVSATDHHTEYSSDIGDSGAPLDITSVGSDETLQGLEAQEASAEAVIDNEGTRASRLPSPCDTAAAPSPEGNNRTPVRAAMVVHQPCPPPQGIAAKTRLSLRSGGTQSPPQTSGQDRSTSSQVAISAQSPVAASIAVDGGSTSVQESGRHSACSAEAGPNPSPTVDAPKNLALANMPVPIEISRGESYHSAHDSDYGLADHQLLSEAPAPAAFDMSRAMSECSSPRDSEFGLGASQFQVLQDGPVPVVFSGVSRATSQCSFGDERDQLLAQVFGSFAATPWAPPSITSPLRRPESIGEQHPSSYPQTPLLVDYPTSEHSRSSGISA